MSINFVRCIEEEDTDITIHDMLGIVYALRIHKSRPENSIEVEMDKCYEHLKTYGNIQVDGVDNARALTNMLKYQICSDIAEIKHLSYATEQVGVYIYRGENLPVGSFPFIFPIHLIGF
jgi:hypothetical protein